MMGKVSDFDSIQSEDIKHVEMILKYIGPGKVLWNTQVIKEHRCCQLTSIMIKPKYQEHHKLVLGHKQAEPMIIECVQNLTTQLQGGLRYVVFGVLNNGANN